MRRMAAGVAFGVVAAWAGAAAARESEDAAPGWLATRWGGDVRLRQEAFDDIPIKAAEPAVTRGGRNDYFRIRTRLNGGLDFGERVSLDARLANEFRVRDCGAESYEWPDELIVDRLALTLRGLAGGTADLALGRQDVVLGSGRLFAEGTAKDGSRTSFFDGARLTVRAGEKRTLDVFGFHGRCENELAVGNEHRDMTGLAGGWNGMDETTAGAFWEDRSIAGLGWGAYYVWLRDSSWKTKDGERVPKEDIHTVGARLMPEFGGGVSAELEGALQFGGDGDGRRAGFAVGGVKWTGKDGAWVGANGLFLSGDDAGTERREDFNVLFGRYPWISELLLYGFDADGVGTWHNLAQAWVEAGVRFGDGGGHRLKAAVGPVYAPERDGAGGGRGRGWLGSAFYSFPVAKGKWGALTGHLFGEVFEPGDYYVSGKTAYFARWQLNWEF